MEWFLMVVAAGGAAFTARWWRTRQMAQRAWAEELQSVRHVVVEDVACLGHRLQRFDREVGAGGLDEKSRVAYNTAVASYESARRGSLGISDVGEVSRVVQAIAAGHNALAQLQAHLAGRQVSGPQVMCFFNPQHGLADSEVLWFRPGYGKRRVPACSNDVHRVADNLEPEIRKVTIGARTTPYWTAGDAFRPYTKGYFASVATLSWAFNPEVADAAARAAGPGYFGTGIVGSSGHFDGGGFDGSGAPPD